MEKQTLFWLFIGIFAITAIITLLGITGVIKSIKEKYLNTLFTALILEVIAAVFLIFKGFDFAENKVDLAAIISDAGLTAPSEVEKQEPFVIAQLASTLSIPQLESDKALLQSNIKDKDKLIAQLEEANRDKGASFYSTITELDHKIDFYKENGLGRSINLLFEPTKKEDVYKHLVSAFGYIDKISEGDGSVNTDKSVNKPRIQRLYSTFKATYSSDSTRFHHISEYDLSQIVKAKLKMDE